jgi:hypothetical protein
MSSSSGALSEVKWVPVATAAKALKVSRQRVYKLVELGYLTAQDLDGHKLISLRSVHDRIAGQSSMEV